MNLTQEATEDPQHLKVILENSLWKTQVYEMKSLNSFTQFNKSLA
jgi:hypothetical protein